MGFSELVEQIQDLLTSQARVTVAVSGFGGSGKSHLVDRLRGVFFLRENQVVRIDHLYSSNPDGPDIFDQVDWSLLSTILRAVHAGQRLRYVGRGFRGERLPVDEKLPRVVIIEGIRLLQPQLMPLFDVSVWIDCPQRAALECAKARDRGQGEDEETIARWDTDWGPKDREYFERFRPDRLASCLYRPEPRPGG